MDGKLKKKNIFGMLLTFLWVEMSLLLFLKKVGPLIDSLFLGVIGKSFSQRSFAVQLIFITISAVLLSFLIYSLLGHAYLRNCIITGSLSLTLAMLLIICALQTLRRDDYWEIHDAGLYGFPGFITFEYLTVNGRYFSLFLKSIYQFVSPALYINTLLAVNILLLCIGSIYLMKIPGSGFSRQMRIIGGISLALGLIFMSPNIWEVWFWGGGTLIYGIGIMLCVWAAALMLDISFTNNRIWLKTFAAAFVIFCACGTSELITISTCFFSLMITILPKLIRKSKWNRMNVFLTLFAWIIAAVVLATSGDIRDASKLSGNHIENLIPLVLQFPEKIMLSVSKIAIFFYSRIEYAAVFALIAFVIGLCGSVTVSGKGVIAAVIVLLIAAVGSLLINAIIGFMPVRVLSVPLDWVYLAISLFMVYTGSRIKVHIRSIIETGVIRGVISLSLLTVVGYFYANNIGLVRDIRKAWVARDQVLREMNGYDGPVETCAIPVLGSGRADPSDDPTQDFNIVTAYYYGFPSVTADYLCPPFE